MSVLTTVVMVLILWILMAFLSWLWVYLSAKNSATLLKPQLFSDELSQSTSGQLIDVRDTAAYKRSRIKGARNIPSANFAQGKAGLRKDQKIFLYDEKFRDAVRVSKILKKQGYDKNNIYILRGGFAQYPGNKTK